MSYAWKQLRLAVRALTATGSQRERLTLAYYKLAALQQKDLPAMVRPTFARLMQNIGRYPARAMRDEIRSKVESLNDAHVAAAMHAIIDLYDAVTRYQPLPSGAKAQRPREEEAADAREEQQPEQLVLPATHACALTLIVDNSAGGLRIS